MTESPAPDAPDPRPPAQPRTDMDPGLAPDPEHEVHENPPEGAGPTGP